ncbi:hypothetical protein A943_13210 [Bacillus sp. CPSM8]|nr:hypothetical protein A943_13210 [Bacillus sp. CPSM8]
MDLILKSVDSILIVFLAIFFMWKFVYEIKLEKRKAVILLLLLINVYFIVKVFNLVLQLM